VSFGYRVADYGYTKLKELFEALPHIIQIMGEGSRAMITLSHRAQLKRFTSDLLRVLKSQSSKQVSLFDFPQVFEKVMNRVFRISDYGVSGD
jgi:meiosis arrest female protein 1